MKILPPRENTFETVMVDITHRCNMRCANCYLPNQDVPDMDIARLKACLAQFPQRANIRIAGAEPTMRSDLPEIVARIKRSGHRVVLLTNGLRLAREHYVRESRDAGLRHVYISMNGADNDDWYERIDGLRGAAKKLQAVGNMVANRMVLNTGAILIRGINEGAVKRIVDLVRSHAPRHALLRFKNVGALGRYDKEAEKNNLGMAEMEELVAEAIGCNAKALSSYTHFKGEHERNTRLFPFDLRSRTGQGLWIKLTNWQADADGFVDRDSTRRGRIAPRLYRSSDMVKITKDS